MSFGSNVVRIFRAQSNGQYSMGQQAAGHIGNNVGTVGNAAGQGITYHKDGQKYTNSTHVYAESMQTITGIAGSSIIGKANPYLGLTAFGLKIYDGKELGVSDYAGLAASVLSLFGPVGIAAGALVTVAGVAYKIYTSKDGKEVEINEIPITKDDDGEFKPFEYYKPYIEMPLKTYPILEPDPAVLEPEPPVLEPDPAVLEPETPSFGGAEDVKSPLAIDLDGDGIATYAMKKGVFFDIDKDGFAEKMGWLTEKDAFLAIDRNKNGVIDDASELFGDSDKAANGFEALKALDTNGDGVIDANDAGWEDLMLWIDAINDGISQENELVTAADAGIEYIELNYKEQDVTDENGNQHLQSATVHWADGRETVIEDIWFQHNNAKTIDLTPLDVTEEEWAELAELPYIDGFGNVHSLWVAMNLDACNDEFFTKSSDFQAA